MKVRADKEKKEFKPIKLSITLETLEEAKAFYSIFNITPICNFAKACELRPGEIRKVLDKSVGDEEGEFWYHGNMMNLTEELKTHYR